MKQARVKNVEPKRPTPDAGDTLAQVVEVLKQDVLKWEEAANAVGHWMPKVTESDRVALAERGRQYTRNARELREFMEQLRSDGFLV